MPQITIAHATPARNIPRILQEGLDPGRAKDKWGRIWFVAEDRVGWAVQHVMKKHGITDPNQMRVIILRVDERLLRRNRAPGMYHTAHILRVTEDQIKTARPYLVKG